MDTTLTTKLCALMLSEDYEDWLRAWELIRDNMPESVTTFDELDEMLDLEAEECSVNDMLYELDSELYTAGLDDPRLPAKRAEVSR